MGHIFWIASYPHSGNRRMRSFLYALVNQGIDNPLGLDLFAPDEASAEFYEPLLGRPPTEATIRQLGEIRPRVHTAVANLIPGFIFVKTNSLLADHAGSPTVTAEVTAGAIYLVRNPLDIVVSMMGKEGLSAADAVAQLNERGRIIPQYAARSYVLLSSWSEHVQSWAGKKNPRVAVVRLEDLAADPASAFGKVVEFLNMDARKSAVEKAVRESRVGAGGREGNATQRSIGWRSVLREAEVSTVVRANRRGMQNFGYWLPEFDLL